MELALVVAIIPALALADAERRLHEIGVRGITVSKVKGYGEHANFFSRDWMIDEVKVEVFAARDQVEGIRAAILDAAHTGGIVAILPVDQGLQRPDAGPRDTELGARKRLMDRWQHAEALLLHTRGLQS